MRILATAANSLWFASNLFAWRRFRSALCDPAQTQRQYLQKFLSRNATCAFARDHKLAATRSYEEFAERLPLQTYESLTPWMNRVRQGETSVLTNEHVTHLIPTSGSTDARKLIPFTAGLQREFDSAIGPWLCDLAWQNPQILGGPAYWSISPDFPEFDENALVPIGFADDAAYLGGIKSRLVRAVLLAPPVIALAHGLAEFQRTTLRCLLRERELRLISIWHPTFLTLLLDVLPLHWDALLADIAQEDSHRARELRTTDPQHPETLWPHLRVISCWGDAHAQFGLEELRRRLPTVQIQPKGLLATEACVTIPFGGCHPLAVRSHFFEFQDESGQIHLAHRLREGEVYEVIVTTSGGLWRYRLGDLVRVTGFLNATPTLQFLGRKGVISDLRGEKLSESFVAACIQRVAAKLEQPRFAMLAPEMPRNAAPHYVLFLNCEGAATRWQTALEAELRHNPHYDYCRQLGQLSDLIIREVAPSAAKMLLQQEAASGKRLGEIKTSYLSKRTNWTEVFG